MRRRCSPSWSSVSPTILEATETGKVCNRGGSSCVDGVALVLGIGMGLGDDVLGLLVRCLDDASALGLGVLAGLKNDVCRLTAGVGDELVRTPCARR